MTIVSQHEARSVCEVNVKDYEESLEVFSVLYYFTLQLNSNVCFIAQRSV